MGWRDVTNAGMVKSGAAEHAAAAKIQSGYRMHRAAGDLQALESRRMALVEESKAEIAALDAKVSALAGWIRGHSGRRVEAAAVSLHRLDPLLHAAETELAVHAGDTTKPERSTSTDSASGEAATALSAAKEALMLGLSSSETPASELEVLAAALRKAADACGGAAAGGAEAVVMLGACAARLRRIHVGRAG